MRWECMRVIRWLVVGLFVLSLGLWTLVRYQEWKRQDVHTPIITAQPEVLNLSVDEMKTGLMEGVQAWDEEEGDLTEQVILGGLSSLSSDGSCYVSYTVFDRANHSATLRRKVVMEDYHSPQFQLISALVFEQGGKEDPISYIRAFDMLEGEITDSITSLENDLDMGQPGEYMIQVQVANSMGDLSELSLPVHVLEQGEVALENQCPLLYLACGESWNAYDYVWAISGQGEEKLQIEDGVDASTPGVYQVHYWAGKQHTWMTVVVYE